MSDTSASIPIVLIRVSRLPMMTSAVSYYSKKRWTFSHGMCNTVHMIMII